MVLLLVCYVTLFGVFVARNISLLAANAAVTRTYCPSSSLLTPCFVDNISKFVEDPGSCGDEGGVSSLRDGGVLSGLTPDLQENASDHLFGGRVTFSETQEAEGSVAQPSGAVASLVSWPLPVLSCCAGAFLALSRRVLLCVFGLFLAVGVAFQLPGWEGRRVRFLFLFPLMGTDPSSGVSRYPFTFVAVVFLFAVTFRLSLLLCFAVVL